MGAAGATGFVGQAATIDIAATGQHRRRRRQVHHRSPRRPPTHTAAHHRQRRQQMDSQSRRQFTNWPGQSLAPPAKASASLATDNCPATASGFAVSPPHHSSPPLFIYPPGAAAAPRPPFIAAAFAAAVQPHTHLSHHYIAHTIHTTISPPVAPPSLRRRRTALFAAAPDHRAISALLSMHLPPLQHCPIATTTYLYYHCRQQLLGILQPDR